MFVNVHYLGIGDGNWRTIIKIEIIALEIINQNQNPLGKTDNNCVPTRRKGAPRGIL